MWELDDAIKYCREYSDTFLSIRMLEVSDKYETVAQWLEELKQRRNADDSLA